MASKVFRRVGGLRPGRSVFDLSYEKKFTCDMGQLIPVMCDEVVPGDTFVIGNEVVIRFQPLVAPILHEINCYVHYFFVPYRLLWDDWEEFITGGEEGTSDLSPPFFQWGADTSTSRYAGQGTLWDYFGFPVGVKPTGRFPLAFPWEAYRFIYNEYYRDENLQDEIPEPSSSREYLYYVLNRSWEKDYFTSALPWQQRGTAPALPLSGIPGSGLYFPGVLDNMPMASIAGMLGMASAGSAGYAPASTNDVASRFRQWLQRGEVDWSKVATFDVSDLRRAFQIQKWMERNARAGARYTEFLQSHFGVHPRDDRLNRPEYIGGSKSPVLISEVLQTSASNITGGATQQGNMAGHGITADRTFVAKYSAKEFGLIMGIMSVMPRSAYQQGIDRQWLRRTRYDFYFPEFANLSEQAIEQVEIMAVSGSENANKAIFGYQGRYDEMRVKRNMVCSGMRETYDYWHLGRKFSVSSPPKLNEEFIKCVPRKDIFAVASEPGLIVSFGNKIKAIRPMPYIAEPGLLDHH